MKDEADKQKDKRDFQRTGTKGKSFLAHKHLTTKHINPRKSNYAKYLRGVLTIIHIKAQRRCELFLRTLRSGD